jgi:hypothetical protein
MPIATTGGDTLDSTQIADKLPSGQMVQVFAESQNGNSGYDIPVQGTALNNWKLKAFAGGGTEITAARIRTASSPTSCSLASPYEN